MVDGELVPYSVSVAYVSGYRRHKKPGRYWDLPAQLNQALELLPHLALRDCSTDVTCHCCLEEVLRSLVVGPLFV